MAKLGKLKAYALAWRNCGRDICAVAKAKRW